MVKFRLLMLLLMLVIIVCPIAVIYVFHWLKIYSDQALLITCIVVTAIPLVPIIKKAAEIRTSTDDKNKSTK